MEQSNINVKFSEITGKIKPMHSVNNGPYSDYIATLFKEAEIPYARNHDANFWTGYGAPHTVDIIAIFPNFDADENDPKSYDFHLTDEYNKKITDTGTKIFYRLGNKIEHESKRYGSIPPKDPYKFARICEHIIRHMNEGWADGTYLDIEYWEIWNEPDMNPQCWEGPYEDYYKLYDITSRHLKKRFPNLKIGGPAITHASTCIIIKPFFEYITRDKNDPAPLDFFSFHCYVSSPDEVARQAEIARGYLKEYGYQNTETILNEWNYLRGWSPIEVKLYNYSVIPALKGSAFVSAAMLKCQESSLDHLMYYDAAAPSVWNGLFDRITHYPQKPYFSILAFSKLYLLGKEVSCKSDTDTIYTSAAISEDGNKAAVIMTNYEDNDSIDGLNCNEQTKTVRIDWNGFISESGVKVTYNILDGKHNLEPISEETFFGNNGAHILKLPLYATILITLEKI